MKNFEEKSDKIWELLDKIAVMQSETAASNKKTDTRLDSLAVRFAKNETRF